MRLISFVMVICRLLYLFCLYPPSPFPYPPPSLSDRNGSVPARSFVRLSFRPSTRPFARSSTVPFLFVCAWLCGPDCGSAFAGECV